MKIPRWVKVVVLPGVLLLTLCFIAVWSVLPPVRQMDPAMNTWDPGCRQWDATWEQLTAADVVAPGYAADQINFCATPNELLIDTAPAPHGIDQEPHRLLRIENGKTSALSPPLDAAINPLACDLEFDGQLYVVGTRSVGEDRFESLLAVLDRDSLELVREYPIVPPSIADGIDTRETVVTVLGRRGLHTLVLRIDIYAPKSARARASGLYQFDIATGELGASLTLGPQRGEILAYRATSDSTALILQDSSSGQWVRQVDWSTMRLEDADPQIFPGVDLYPPLARIPATAPASNATPRAEHIGSRGAVYSPSFQCVTQARVREEFTQLLQPGTAARLAEVVQATGRRYFSKQLTDRSQSAFLEVTDVQWVTGLEPGAPLHSFPPDVVSAVGNSFAWLSGHGIYCYALDDHTVLLLQVVFPLPKETVATGGLIRLGTLELTSETLQWLGYAPLPENFGEAPQLGFRAPLIGTPEGWLIGLNSGLPSSDYADRVLFWTTLPYPDDWTTRPLGVYGFIPPGMSN